MTLRIKTNWWNGVKTIRSENSDQIFNAKEDYENKGYIVIVRKEGNYLYTTLRGDFAIKMRPSRSQLEKFIDKF